MANPPSPAAAPVTEADFLKDRQGMLESFVSFTTVSVIALIILLAAMGLFLL